MSLTSCCPGCDQLDEDLASLGFPNPTTRSPR